MHRVPRAAARSAEPPAAVVGVRGSRPDLWPESAGPAEETFSLALDTDGTLVASRSGLEGPLEASRTTDPVGALRRALAGTGTGAEWVGWLAYEFGWVLEPSARPRPLRGPMTLAEFHRLQPAARIRATPGARPYRLRIDAPMPGRSTYERAVRQALEFIRAGDIYQANIRHDLTGTFEGCARGLFASLDRRCAPAFGAVIVRPGGACGPGNAIVSLSPELFLRYDAGDGSVVAEPMKGTRAARADPAELFHAPKDRAELAMIVDLMRNDLSRVCSVGSVRVACPRRVQRHGSGVWQATATVVGTLRPRFDLWDLIAATFPPGSVTGAPKIRAMQIIDELEGSPRGVYCGSIVRIDPAGNATLSVAIRTATLTGSVDGDGLFTAARAVFPVGAGIVADSDPAAEWRECLDKGRAFLDAAQTPEPLPAGEGSGTLC